MSIFGYLTTIFIALTGLFVGSFLNVVIYRLPRECLSVVKQTRSRCPRCSVQLGWYDNIPLISYLFLLRGKCRYCKAPISARYPLVEAFTGAAFVGLAMLDLDREVLEYPWSASTPWMIWLVHVFVVSNLIALSVIDMDFRILPDAITLPGNVVAPLLVFAVPEVLPGIPWQPFSGDGDWVLRFNALANGVTGAVAAAGLLYGIGWVGSKVFRKPAMGLGDVKLFGAMGGLSGLWFPLALIIACFVGSIIGIAVLAFQRDRYIPFGPFLAVGMIATMLRGQEMLDGILSILLG